MPAMRPHGITGAMLEARAHAGPGGSEAENVASTLQLALGDALQGDMGPVERSHALSALIWAQVGPSALMQGHNNTSYLKIETQHYM